MQGKELAFRNKGAAKESGSADRYGLYTRRNSMANKPDTQLREVEHPTKGEVMA